MKKTDLDKLNFIQQFMQKCNPQMQPLGVKGKTEISNLFK